MKKRIISLILAMILVFSACYVTTLVSAAVVDSTLTLDSSSTAGRLLFTGTDSVSVSGISKKFVPATESDGVIVNSVMNSELKFYKSAGKWNLFLADNAVAGTTVTILGTFTYETTSVRFATITLKYNGNAWFVTENPDITNTEYNRSFSLNYVDDENKYGTSAGIFLTGDDSLEYDETGSTFISFDEGENNGVFLNDTKTDVQMKKIGEHDWYLCLTDANITAKKDDVITIKGAITHKGKTAVFNVASFVFDGNTWLVNVNVEKCAFELHYTNEEIKYGTATGIYLKSNDSIEHDASWGTYISFEAGNDNGVFLNGTKTSAKMKKFTATEWYVCLSEENITAKTGDIITVKGYISHKSSRVLFEEISLVFNGTTWGLTDDPNLETGRTLTFDPTAPNSATGIYLKGDDSLVAPGWETNIYNDGATDSGVFLNGVKTEVFMKKVADRSWYVCLTEANITAKKDDKITIMGVFTHGKVKVAFNKVDLVYNGTNWEEVVDTQVVSFDLVDLLTSSKYNTESKKWEIYFSTTKPIPGVDETTTFDVLMKIGNRDKTIRCKKSAIEHSFAFEIDSSVIPQNPTSEISLTIRAGKYEINGENNKIKLESNILLYFANGNVSLTSADFKPDEENITFSLDRDTEGGGTSNGIYLIANDNVPYDVNWNTKTLAYDGRANGVFLNGVKTDAFFKKYDANKYYVCLIDVNVVPEEGDIIVIKGAFKTNNYLSSYKAYTLTFKDGAWVDGTEPETNYKKVQITGYDSTVSGYFSNLNRWHFYFTTKEMLPGDRDQVFNFVNVKINDDVYTLPCYHTAHNDLFLILIDDTKLPKNAKATVEVYGKAKSNDRLIGMDVQKFKFYVNQYGVSMDGYLSPIQVKENNMTLTLDTVTPGWTGGTDSGVYFLTKDHFDVDETWATPIRAISYDDNSGIFYNGVKINALFKKYSEGKIYLDFLSAGVVAKDRDQVTIKGTFALGSYGVSYKEITLYYNGQSWAMTYKDPIPKQTVNLTPTGIKSQSCYKNDRNAWEIFIKINEKIPGDNNYEFRTIKYEINGVSYEASTYRVEDSLVFYIPDTVLPKDSKDGTAIKIKEGIASDRFALYDINLTKDCTAYIFHKGVSDKKPANNTKYLDLNVSGLIETFTFNEDSKSWNLLFKIDKEFDVDDGAKYFDLPVKLNGKTYEDICAYRGGDFLYIVIPESVLPKDAKTATLTIDKGAKAVTNSGWNGIHIKNSVSVYLFNKVWSDQKFTEQTSADLNFAHLNFASYNTEAKRWDIYLNTDKEVPGTHWYEKYEGVNFYLNGKKHTIYLKKAESANNKWMYVAFDESVFGKFKEGDIMYLPKGSYGECGGYRINITRDFYLQYINGTWFEYYPSNVKAPKAYKSIWQNARIDNYIPVQEDKGIIFTNVEPTNVIKSIEDAKDFTFTFETTKMLFNNEELPTNSIVLRGQPLTEGMDVSETALYGYNISFNYIELTKEHVPDNPELWGTHSQQISVWKNGINHALLDQYRMTYNWIKEDHPFFEHDKKYKFTISIYNVTEDVCIIEIYCNDKLVMRVVDHGTDDPMDPVYNGGEFRIYASCPQHFYAPEVELDTLSASQTECFIGEQVRVSATYPAILEGTEYTVDGDGATIKDGVFIATKEGTYTVTGFLNGKSKGTVQIKVTKKPLQSFAVEETSEFPIIPVAIGGGVVLLAAAVVLLIVLIKKKKNKQIAE